MSVDANHWQWWQYVRISIAVERKKEGIKAFLTQAANVKCTVTIQNFRVFFFLIPSFLYSFHPLVNQSVTCFTYKRLNITPAKYSTVCPQMTKPFSIHFLSTMGMISFLLSLNQSGECIQLHHLFIFGYNEQWINILESVTESCIKATDLQVNQK